MNLQNTQQLTKGWARLCALFSNETSHLQELNRAIGYGFKDAHLLYEAVTHRSAVERNSFEGRTIQIEFGIVLPWNERLEFLGDSVVSLIVSSLLWAAEPDWTEGELSRVRSQLINEQMLASLARTIGLDRCLLLGRGEALSGGRNKDSLLADAFEALVGAVYRDSDFVMVNQIFRPLFEELLTQSNLGPTHADFKSQLQEIAQGRYKETPIYKTLSAEGPEHDRSFVVGAFLGGRALATGEGSSKKRASQEAARNSLPLIQSIENVGTI